MNRKYKARQSKEIEKELYLFYVRYIKTNGYAPGYKEAAEELNVSVYTIKRHVRSLITRGLLQTNHPQESRAIAVSGYEYKRKGKRYHCENRTT